jgi:RimJ/RimL family protein N-acetyltransferase/GNAT superfamily N-acetyltransferase
LAARRNDPDVAKYQNWSLPFPIERAMELEAELLAMDGPQNEEWWMAVVVELESGRAIGDLALHLGQEARTAEIGYTFETSSWGHGYAVEAMDALIAYLFNDLHVTRIFGMLHPENTASAMVMERTGFLYEGHTKLSFWLEDVCEDDWIYGLIRADWETWRNRPRQPPSEVSLVEVTVENERLLSKLTTHKSQESYVAPMFWSFTDALFPEVINGAQVVPWMRAVLADDEIVGFVMLAIRTEHHPEPYLWRLLIDRLHQRRGIGGRVLDLIAEECLKMGDATLITSWGEGKGSPRPFYLSHGFEPTGAVIDEETEGRRRLA